jgi:aerobic-type carbon monoxide dehydrogenase small subunit (CoxS/CutS family)
MKESVELVVNGEGRQLQADPRTPLLDVLRDELGLTGSKYGCGEGQCGACTVLVDGRALRSCITPLSVVAGRDVRSIEGLAEGDDLHPVQQAFLDEGALQCGYCTSGMIMAAVDLLENKPNPKEAEIKSGMTGNICRCGTYPRVVKAIQRAAQNMGRAAK